MTTEYHDLLIPSPGTYADDFEQLADELDAKLLLAGTLAARPDIDAVPDGTWYLDTEGSANDDAQAVLYAARPTGAWEIVDLEIATDLSAVPQTGDHFTVTGTWGAHSLGEVWQADIEGAASTADETDHAEVAATAHVVAGFDGSEFADAGTAITVLESWTHTATQTFEDGMTCEGGVLGLPGHTN